MEIVRDGKGKFVKGHIGTKPKGSFHRISTEIRDKLSVFLLERSHQLPAIWKKLTDKEKARLFVEVAAFVIPKQKDVSITAMNEPSKEAIARLFDFSDAEETATWIEHTKEKVFPKSAV